MSCITCVIIFQCFNEHAILHAVDSQLELCLSNTFVPLAQLDFSDFLLLVS